MTAEERLLRLTTYLVGFMLPLCAWTMYSADDDTCDDCLRFLPRQSHSHSNLLRGHSDYHLGRFHSPIHRHGGEQRPLSSLVFVRIFYWGTGLDWLAGMAVIEKEL